MNNGLAIDLYCGLGGWTEGLQAEGFDVIGFDNERHVYGEHRYPATLVIQDVLTLDGRQFKDADLIVASPPCQEYSYMAMPWKRAKQIAAALRGEGKFPKGYKGSRTVDELNRLFDACFRIQREASDAAGRHIPMVVENVRGAQPWVGNAEWHYGSYYLWGDVPALMPIPMKARKRNPDGTDHGPGSWFAVADSKNRGYKSQGLNWSDQSKRGQDFTRVAGNQAIKNNGGSWFNVAHNTSSGTGRNPVHDGRKHGGDWFNDPTSPGRQGGVKQPGIGGKRKNGKGDAWFQDGAAKSGSRSAKRKFASAMIAKIPLGLSRHIARVYRPSSEERRT